MAISPSSKSNQSSTATIKVSLRDRWWWGPLAVLFKGVIKLRHWSYDIGIKRSKKGALPAIVLGNITVGGTGKTPHVMALLQALSESNPNRRWAILSRGYGRKTKGYLEVDKEGSPEEFGDEPLELARKFPKSKSRFQKTASLAFRPFTIKATPTR